MRNSNDIYLLDTSMTDLDDGYYKFVESFYDDSSCTMMSYSEETFQFATCMQDTEIPNMKSSLFSHVDSVPVYLYDGFAIR